MSSEYTIDSKYSLPVKTFLGDNITEKNVKRDSKGKIIVKNNCIESKKSKTGHWCYTNAKNKIFGYCYKKPISSSDKSNNHKSNKSNKSNNHKSNKSNKSNNHKSNKSNKSNNHKLNKSNTKTTKTRNRKRF